jgi:hypothetical protein
MVEAERKGIQRKDGDGDGDAMNDGLMSMIVARLVTGLLWRRDQLGTLSNQVASLLWLVQVLTRDGGSET